jgi:ATP-dependent Zn protease
VAAAERLSPSLPSREVSTALADQWRVLTRVATGVALLTSPAVYLWLHEQAGWSVGWSIVVTFVAVAAFRGLVDLALRRAIPWPSLFGTDDRRLREEDVLARRRSWFWRFWFRLALLLVSAITVFYVFQLLTNGFDDSSWISTAGDVLGGIGRIAAALPAILPLGALFFVYFIFNFLILLGPLLMMGISQIRAFEPGDADWGVKLEDVRGQAEAKEEIRRIVSLWQSGEAFVKAGGKRERGILFLGAPGTGKTMLAKAIATGFNCPFVSIPGSGFAQAFFGIDAVIVRYLARKAKRLARKWGGQCIVFIDEIDAVGMRRSSLAGAPSATPLGPHDVHSHLFFGPFGALNPSGDLILETRAWRERLFAQRAPARPPAHPWIERMNQGIPGMMGGNMSQLALNQLLVVMDGIDNPPFMRRTFTNRVNTLLDAMYIVPRRVGEVSLRLPPPKPLAAQIYFIGATNVPMENLDPALTRPGRMGRHVWFRTPTKRDREDIFDLYLDKVAHDPDLDSARRRDELARVTNGYSPAMIEQVCSMALTYAHHDGRERFGWEDIVEALTTVESGTAVGVEYVPEEKRSTAIHEAGHAAAAHAFLKGNESTRLSIRMRGGSLGHHQARQREERFGRWRSEQIGYLIWGLGAMAAERVFYGENGTGVSGDVQSTTGLAAMMVGAWAMGPDTVRVDGKLPRGRDREEVEQELRSRFEALGNEIMNTTADGGPFAHDPISSVIRDPQQRRLVAQMIGQAYVTTHNFIAANKDAVERIADALIEKGELFGDELNELLERQNLQIPELDLLDEETWPKAA